MNIYMCIIVTIDMCMFIILTMNMYTWFYNGRLYSFVCDVTSYIPLSYCYDSCAKFIFQFLIISSSSWWSIWWCFVLTTLFAGLIYNRSVSRNCVQVYNIQGISDECRRTDLIFYLLTKNNLSSYARMCSIANITPTWHTGTPSNWWSSLMV